VYTYKLDYKSVIAVIMDNIDLPMNVKKHNAYIKIVAILIALIFLSENAGYSFADAPNNKTTLRPPLVFSKGEDRPRPAVVLGETAQFLDEIDPIAENIIELLEWVVVPFALSEDDKVYARFLGINEDGQSGTSRIASDLRKIERYIVPAILENTAGRSISPEARFLDIGSGSGIVVLYFALRFKIKATGIELDERQYRIAEKLKAYLVKEGDLEEGQVTFIHGDATAFSFDSYQICYYHSPHPGGPATDLDLKIFRKIIKELPASGQFISTLKTIPEDMMPPGEFATKRVFAGVSSGPITVSVTAADIYTRTHHRAEASDNHGSQPIAILETPLESYDYRLAIQRAREWLAAGIAGGTIREEMNARAHALLEAENLGLGAFMELLALRYDTLRPENTASLPTKHVEFLDNSRGTFAEVAGIKETQIIFVSKEDRFLWALGSREMADNPPGGMRIIFSDEQGYIQQVIMVPYDGRFDKADIVDSLSHEAEHCREAFLASQRYAEPLIEIIIEGRQRFWQSEILTQFRERLLNEARRRIKQGGDYHLVYQLVRLLDRSMAMVSYPRAEKFVSHLIELAGKEAVDNIHKTGEVEQLANALGQERFEALLLFLREWDQKSFLHSSTAAGLSIGLAMDIVEAILLKGDSGKLPLSVSKLREFMGFLQSQGSLVGEESKTLEQILSRGIQSDRDTVLQLAVAYAKEEIDLEHVKHQLSALHNFSDYTITALATSSGVWLPADEGAIKEPVGKSGIAGLSFAQVQAIQDIVNRCGVTAIVVGSAAADQLRLQEARTQREGSPRPVQDLDLIVRAEGQTREDVFRMLVQALQGLGPAVGPLEDKTPSFPGEPMITFRPNQLPEWFQGLDKYYLTGAAAKVYKSQLALLVAVELAEPSSSYWISLHDGLIGFLRTGEATLTSFGGENRKVTLQEVTAYAIRQAQLVMPDWNETDWKDFLFAVRMHFPDNPDVCYDLGRMYCVQGQYQKAEQALKKALKADPSLIDAHVELGIVYAALGDHYHAIQEYEAALTLRPADAIVHYNLAKSHNATSNTTGAIQAYQAAIMLNPKFVNAYWNLALVYYQLYKINEAIDNFAQAVFMDVDSINEVPHELRLQVQKQVAEIKDVILPVTTTLPAVPDGTHIDFTRGLKSAL